MFSDSVPSLANAHFLNFAISIRAALSYAFGGTGTEVAPFIKKIGFNPASVGSHSIMMIRENKSLIPKISEYVGVSLQLEYD